MAPTHTGKMPSSPVSLVSRAGGKNAEEPSQVQLLAQPFSSSSSSSSKATDFSGHKPGDDSMLERPQKRSLQGPPLMLQKQRERLSETKTLRGSNMKRDVCVKTAQSPK